MGKVGSTSVTESLKAANIDRHIYHIHFLRPDLIDYASDFPRSEGFKIYQNNVADVLLLKLEHLTIVSAGPPKRFLRLMV